MVFRGCLRWYGNSNLPSDPDSIRVCLFEELLLRWTNFHFCSREESYVPISFIRNQDPLYVQNSSAVPLHYIMVQHPY